MSSTSLFLYSPLEELSVGSPRVRCVVFVVFCVMSHKCREVAYIAKQTLLIALVKLAPKRYIYTITKCLIFVNYDLCLGAFQDSERH